MSTSIPYVRTPTIEVKFITDRDVFDLKFNTIENQNNKGAILSSGDMTNAIVSLTTENDMNNDSGTFSMVLVAMEHWERILSPNDIVIIKVNPGKPNKVKNDVIMVGMVSAVKRIGEYSSSSVLYQITGQSMMKALMQLKLGTIQEVASMLGTNGWMIGMGGLKGAQTYTGGSDDNNDGGSSEVSGNSNAEKIWNQLRAAGFTTYAAAGILGNMQAESGLNPDISQAGGGGGYGLVQWTPRSKLTAYANSVNKSESSLSVQVEFLIKQLKGTTKFSPDTAAYGPLMSARNVTDATSAFLTLYERAGVANLGARVSAANKYYSAYKGNSTSSATQGTSSNNKVTTDGSQGLALFGQSAASIARQLIDWFIVLHTAYRYDNDNKSIKNYIETDLSSWEDESLADPQPIMSFEGSLRQLMTQVQAKPYNEFFEDFTTDGKMVFRMRKTPFEPADWQALYQDQVSLYSKDVLEESLGQTDSEAYSIFMANMPSSVMIPNISAVLSYPVYFPDLADRYGYSMLNVNNPYIFALKNKSTSGGSDDSSSSSSNPASDNLPKITSGDAKNIAMASMAWNDDSITAGRLNQYIKTASPSSPFNGKGKVFIEAGKESGLNPVIIIAFAALESAWGSSSLAKAGNFFGIGAFDNNPNNGKNYGNSSMDKGIVAGAKWIRKNYYDAGQKTLHSLFNNNGVHQYSTTPDEDMRIGYLAAPYYKLFGGKSQKKMTNSQLKDFFDKKKAGNRNNSLIDNAVNNENNKKKKSKKISNSDAKKFFDSKKTGNSAPLDSGTNKSKKDSKKESKDGSSDSSSKTDKKPGKNAYNLKKYSVLLANWYGDNISYTSGEIRVVGNPDYRVGKVLVRYDNGSSDADAGDNNPYRMDFYIESVRHEFNMTSGYTTALGVTRGLSANLNRFSHWNTWDDPLTADSPGAGQLQAFVGGLFGEMTFVQNAQEHPEDSDGDGDDSSSSSDRGGSTSQGKGDDYPSKWRNVPQDSIRDDWGYPVRECTSFAAWRASKESGVKHSDLVQLGDGGMWGDSARSRGIPVYSKPKAGDIAYYKSGGYGHVAYVAKVNGDTMYIEEYNWMVNGGTDGAFHARSQPVSAATGFIRFGK